MIPACNWRKNLGRHGVDNVVETIKDISHDGVMYAVETSGLPQVLRQADDCTKPLGTTAVAGAPLVGDQC